MARPKKMQSEEVEHALASLDGWGIEDGALTRDYRFASFVEAFGFMRKMADVSEKLNHHPDWTNVYDRVAVRMSTHDAGGITELDFEWAREAERIREALKR